MTGGEDMNVVTWLAKGAIGMLGSFVIFILGFIGYQQKKNAEAITKIPENYVSKTDLQVHMNTMSQNSNREADRIIESIIDLGTTVKDTSIRLHKRIDDTNKEMLDIIKGSNKGDKK